MGEQVRSYFAAGIGRIAGFLPQLISAIVIVAIGYLVSRVAASLVRRLLARAGFDRFAARHFRRAATQRSASSLAASAVFWLGLLITASMASNSLGLNTLSAGINRILGFIPNVIVAGLIVAIAVPVSRMLASLVAGVGGSTVGRAAQVAILGLGVFMALDQLGISRTIVATTFIAVLGAVAIAIAIAFGVGNIPIAREVTGRWVRRERVPAPGPEVEREVEAGPGRGVTEH